MCIVCGSTMRIDRERGASSDLPSPLYRYARHKPPCLLEWRTPLDPKGHGSETSSIVKQTFHFHMAFDFLSSNRCHFHTILAIVQCIRFIHLYLYPPQPPARPATRPAAVMQSIRQITANTPPFLLPSLRHGSGGQWSHATSSTLRNV